MSREPLETLTSRSFVIDQPDVDTDQIIPARFLTTTERGSLAEACFHDWRFSDGTPNDHPLNSVDTEGHRILVAADNFGCGSSREHAPWALRDFGVRAVVSSRVADIFRSNALKNGLIVAEVDDETHAALMAAPGTEIRIDLSNMTIHWGNHQTRFEMEPFARTCLRQGLDPLGYIQSHADAITAFEQGRAA